ncbi:uncharacterized protein LOC128232367 [Mya arenaria]|uniref:uncharacterized protein LOC128232367 n=1 Tax=Mya arenaria TaxID=6604 RepID=UPI0022E4F558|nr:uncharacterized protein LOC128232367 [Mya arenaria]
MRIIITVLTILHELCQVAAVPGDCTPLETHKLDDFDPRTVYSANQELATHQPPRRVPGDFRAHRPLPTHHFATTELKKNPSPMILWPYMSTMKADGIVYDAFEFKRFMDPERTIYADGQSLWEEGRPWHRLLELGTNMFQKISGPDGNPLGNFDGQSGVKVGIAGSGEPELQDYGDLFANFIYTGGQGFMEVPLVRGSILLTHIFKNADPLITPYCLDNINGESHTFDCPHEPASSDGGSGYLSATCPGSVLEITLHNTRPIHDVTLVQWAANTADVYSGSHGMHTCTTSQCRLADGGKTVHISVPNASGQMSFAINYIGHYLLPPDWVNHPQQVSCGSGKRDVLDHHRRAVQDINMHATCDSNKNVEIRVDLAGNYINETDWVQYAIEGSSIWAHPPPMRNCDPSHCTRQGNVVTIKYHSQHAHIKLAINIVGVTTLPWSYWIDNPFYLVCGTGQVVNYGGSGTVTVTSHTNPPTTTSTSTSQPTQTAATEPVAHTTVHNPAPTGVPLGPNKKFILEMNEQGKDLPNQTRKFVLYFSEEVSPHVHGNSLTFSPISGGAYTGIMQLAYLGSGVRGDYSNGTMMDRYAGVYSYKPSTSFCVSESTSRAHAVFDWRPNNQHAASPTAELLMLLMPHHSYLMKSMFGGRMVKTVFGFDALEESVWDLSMDLPRAAMTPDPTALSSLGAHQRQDILSAVERDAANQNLAAICGQADSYNVGKAIGMAARLASISRAFGTNHHTAIDTDIRNCLEKWLRIQDTLSDKWKFHYDTVWGGLFLRATDGDLNFGVDYGFPYYNDHHFHLGYFIYALAYYAKFNPQWGQANKHRIYLLVRDVSNLSPSDEFFPVARHKDMYTGFSWASGIVPGTRQEESASEGLNCYHGVAALGEALNDKRLQHVGQVMLAMELMSVREYWQVREHNRPHFPPVIQDTGVVGMVAEDSFYVYTLNWPCDPNRFPMRHACLVGIQVIPITSVSKYWVDKEWAASIEHSCTSAIHPEREPSYSIADHTERSRNLSTGWAAFCYAAMAPLDAIHQAEAANYLKDKRPQELVGGTGVASTLLFIFAST